MKKSYFTILLVVLGFFQFLGTASAKALPPELYAWQVYPTAPSDTDSVYVSLTYTSNDGCPDYYLVVDSVDSLMVSVAVRKIDNSKMVCTLALTKFVTRINLGPLKQHTRIYVDGKLIKTINPYCKLDKKGVVVKGIGDCADRLFICEHTPYATLVPVLYSIERLVVRKGDAVMPHRLSVGDEVRFGGILGVRDTTMAGCLVAGQAICCELIKRFIPITTIGTDTLAGAAYTADSLVKAGTAVLLQKGQRKAISACPLKEGRFEFPNIPAAEYTVYVIPDKTLHPDYLPTFYINKLAFKNADYYALKDGRNEIDVNLRKFEKRPGKGKIHGNVYFERADMKDSVLNYYGDKNHFYTIENKTAVNMPLLLFNSTGTPIAWTKSDESGNYTFEGIALDSYRLVTETAETVAETNVVLSLENATVGVDMMLKPQDATTALTTPQTATFLMSPNPANDRLNIQSTTTEAVRIFNSLGQLSLEQQLNVGNNALNLQNLNPGVYLIKVGMNTQKLIRK